VSNAESPAPRARAHTQRLRRTRTLDWSRVGALWWLPAAAFIGWLTWPYPSVDASAGVDPSWAVALHLAADRGLDFGRDILFTYGPLGFLSQPLLVTTPTGLAAFGFAVAAQFALCAALLWSTLRVYPPWVAIALTYAVAVMFAATGFSNLPDYLVVIAFLLAVYTIERDPPPGAWIVAAGAFLAALSFLIKTNNGIVSIVLLALVVWRCRPGGWRSEALLGGCFAGAVFVLWLVSGNSPAALPSWLHQEAHVVVSYTSAMAIEGTNSGEYLQALLLLIVATAAIAAHVRGLDRKRQVALFAVGVVYALAYLKEGFVRHDVIHAVVFFSALAGGVLAVRWDARTRWIAATVVAAALGAVAMSVGSSGFVYGVHGRISRATHQAEVMLRPSVRRGEYAESRAAAKEKLGVGPPLRRLLRGHSVDVQPYEASAIWAYGLRWKPQRFIQWYMATDRALDLFNAHGLASHGAERVLFERNPPALDGKRTLFMAPETYLVLVCRYRLVQAKGNWAVLRRTRDRCGREQHLRTVRVTAGEPIQIPSARHPGDVVYARIHASPTLKERAAGLVFKEVHHPQVLVDGVAYRLVLDTARGPLVLRLPRGRGLPPTFGNARHRTISVNGVASPYRIDFYSRSVR
jgi:hypothetical protein